MQTNFPDLDGSLWYSDGRQDNICTLSIMGKAVYSILGHLYHPDFLSVYCDNFYHDLMVRSNRMWKSKQPVFHHEWGHENKDDLMRRNENRELYAKDKATYERLLRETYGS